jgi:glycine dehydrogenase subunit 1
MDERDARSHPYVPNAIPDVQSEMFAAIGAASFDELYADIPPSLRLGRPLDLPAPLRSEAELDRHVEGLLDRNTSTHEVLSFLGAGCYPHHVPAVCDEINGRAEFLTAYAGDPYEDHGRFQALFEYASMSRDKRSRILDYLRPDLGVDEVAIDRATSLLDLGALEATLAPDVAAVLVENPTFLGSVETQLPEIVRLARAAGAMVIGSVDPSTLGVLAPPAAWGGEIACGDI